MLLETSLATYPDRNEFISAGGEIIKNFIEEFTANPQQRPSMREGGELTRFRFPQLLNVENEDLYNHLYCYAWNRVGAGRAMQVVGACTERIHLNKNRQLIPRFTDQPDPLRLQIMEGLL